MNEKDEAVELAEEIPDEVIEDTSFYEVHVYGYDRDDKFADYDKVIKTFKDRAEAEKFAEAYIVSETKQLPPPVVYVRIEVELKDDPGDSILYTVSSKVQVIR